MNFVIKYQISDDCTYTCDVIVPVEYESAEALYLDIEKQLHTIQNFFIGNHFTSCYLINPYNNKESLDKVLFKCGNNSIDLYRLWLDNGQNVENSMYALSIYTIDEWFKVNGF